MSRLAPVAGLGRGRRRSGGTLRTFAALLAVSLVLLLTRNVDVVRGSSVLGTQLLVPVQGVLAGVGGSASRFLQAIGEIEDLRNANAKLRADVDRLTLDNVRLREDAIAAQQVARLDATRAALPATVGAAIIARDPSALLKSLVIDAGRDAGVRVGNPVVSERGVVGRVSEVGANYAKVLLITDSASTVSALVQGSRATGIIRGQYGDTLVLDWVLQTEPVRPGDVVLTAGLGLGEELRSLYPKGLIIGTVAEVARSDVSAYLRAIVTPGADLRRLERVLVVTGRF